MKEERIKGWRGPGDRYVYLVEVYGGFTNAWEVVGVYSVEEWAKADMGDEGHDWVRIRKVPMDRLIPEEVSDGQ